MDIWHDHGRRCIKGKCCISSIDATPFGFREPTEFTADIHTNSAVHIGPPCHIVNYTLFKLGPTLDGIQIGQIIVYGDFCDFFCSAHCSKLAKLGFDGDIRIRIKLDLCVDAAQGNIDVE